MKLHGKALDRLERCLKHTFLQSLVRLCVLNLQIKHLQFLSGLHSSSYWLASYAWDLLNTLIPIILTVIIFAAFQVDAFSSSEALGAIFIVLVIACHKVDTGQ